MYAISGYLADDLTGDAAPAYNSIIHPDDQIAVSDAIQNALSAGEPWQIRYRIIHRDGSIRWVEERGGAANGKDGSILFLEGYIIDRTEEKSKEEAAHASGRTLRTLLSTTRHDIQNDIMALEGYLDIAGRASVNQKQAGHLNKARNAAEAIGRRIGWTRRFDRLGSERPAWLPLHTIIRGINTTSLPIELRCNGYLIFSDPLIGIVFSNLKENTINHAGEGASVAVWCQKRDDDLIIIWEDDGPGIPDGEKERIFRRGVGSETRFGLYVSREILSITGSTIREAGKYGEGAKFEIQIPQGSYKRIS